MEAAWSGGAGLICIASLTLRHASFALTPPLPRAATSGARRAYSLLNCERESHSRLPQDAVWRPKHDGQQPSPRGNAGGRGRDAGFVLHDDGHARCVKDA